MYDDRIHVILNGNSIADDISNRILWLYKNFGKRRGELIYDDMKVGIKHGAVFFNGGTLHWYVDTRFNKSELEFYFDSIKNSTLYKLTWS
jgi:hypothetical protein